MHAFIVRNSQIESLKKKIIQWNVNKNENVSKHKAIFIWFAILLILFSFLHEITLKYYFASNTLII